MSRASNPPLEPARVLSSGPQPTHAGSRETLLDYLVQASRTMRQVELGVSITAWLSGILVLLLIAVLMDHWLWPLNQVARFGVFGVLLAWSFWWIPKRIFPLILQPIHPEHTARKIESQNPQLKESLISWLQLSTENAAPRGVLAVVGRFAVRNLGGQDSTSIVDTANVVRLSALLFGIFLTGVMYLFVSPKSGVTSLARMLMPWANIAPAARVRIVDVAPGDATITQGSSLPLTVTVRGMYPGDSVKVRYDLSDGQQIGERLTLNEEIEGIHYRLDFGQSFSGIHQPLQYWIEAGDAVAGPYSVKVQSVPIVAIDRIEFEYPAYMKTRNRTSVKEGTIEAPEGTRIKLFAFANQAMSKSRIEFDPIVNKGVFGGASRVLELATDGTQLNGEWFLQLDEKRNNPTHSSYRLKATNNLGESNVDPVIYKITTLADLPPSVRLQSDLPARIQVPINGSQEIEIRASDRYGLMSVKVNALRDNQAVFQESLFESPHGTTGEVVRVFLFEPQKYNLRAGDTITFWATASDNRRKVGSDQLEPNEGKSSELAIVITGSKDKDPPKVGQQDAKENSSKSTNADAGKSSNKNKSETDKSPLDSSRTNERSQNNKSTSNANNAPNSPPENKSKDDSSSQKQPNNPNENQPSENSSKDKSQSKSNKPDDKSQSSGGEKNGDSSGGSEQGESSSGSSNSSNKSTSKGGAKQAGTSSQSGGDSNASDESTNPSTSSSKSNSTRNGQSGSSSSGDPSETSDDDSDSPKHAGEIFETIEQMRQESSRRAQSSGTQSYNSEKADSQASDRQAENSKDSGSDNQTSKTEDNNSTASKSNDASQRPQSNRNQNSQSPENSSSGKSNEPGTSQTNTNANSKAANAGADSVTNPKQSGNTNENTSKSEPNKSLDQGGQNTNSKASQKDADQPSSSGNSGENPQSNPNSSNAAASNSPSQPSNDPKNTSSADKKGANPSNPGQQSSSNGSKSSDSNNASNAPQSSSQGSPESSSSKSNESQTSGSPSGSKSQKGSPENDRAASGSAESNNEQTGKESGNDSSNAQTGDSAKDSSKGGGDQSPKSGSQKSQSKTGNAKAPSPEKGTSASKEGQNGDSNSDSSKQDSSSNSNSKSNADSSAKSGGKASGSPGQPGADGQPQTGPTPGAAASGPNQSGGIGTGQSGGKGNGVSSTNGESAVNKEYADKVTDLALDYLKQQKDQPDPELLRKLNWTKDDLQKFLEHWSKAKELARIDPEKKRELDSELRSLGLRPASTKERKIQDRDDDLKGYLEEGSRVRAPESLRNQFEQFRRATIK